MINHVDPQRCTGCGQCFKTCSLDVFRLDTRQPSRSPCMAACPAGSDIRACNHLVQQNRMTEALAVLKKTMPFPALTGRVCFHPCEKQCTRTSLDESVNINGLEQFLGDIDLQLPPPQPATRHMAKAAVVGSGPAGLSAAWFLALGGYPVTVFEASPRAGGMMRYGIPAYRLPDAVLDAQLAQLETLGVRFICNTRIGEGADLTPQELLDQGYQSILLAPGLSVGKRLVLEGSDLSGVLTGVDFLHAVREGETPHMGKRVVVVGGGNVAIDAAICAKRLGAEQVSLFCLEDAELMPAFAHNVEHARAEGIVIVPSQGPKRIFERAGQVSGMEFHRCSRLFDAAGVFSPILDAGTATTVEVDSVILAIGQAGDFQPFARWVELSRGGLCANPMDYSTTTPGIFAAGDAVSGPASVVEAVAAGRTAAHAIMRHLKGRLSFCAEPELPVVESMPVDKLPSLERQERMDNPEARGFAETRQGFDTVQALAESMRCLTCGSKSVMAYDDDCMTCYSCELRCPADAISVHPFKERLPYSLYPEGGRNL